MGEETRARMRAVAAGTAAVGGTSNNSGAALRAYLRNQVFIPALKEDELVGEFLDPDKD